MFAYDIGKTKTYTENALGKISKGDARVACASLGGFSVEYRELKITDEDIQNFCKAMKETALKNT